MSPAWIALAALLAAGCTKTVCEEVRVAGLGPCEGRDLRCTFLATDGRWYAAMSGPVAIGHKTIGCRRVPPP